MRKILIVGYLLAFVLAGCAQRPAMPIPATPAPLGEMPKQAPTSPVEMIKHPPACRGADLLYHSRLKQMILVNCVADPSNATLLTVWGWDGTRWQQLSQDGPPARMLGGAAYDDIRDVLVLYGGRPVEQGMCSQETWEWDGEFWEQISALPPTACDHIRMVYDKAMQKSILFSGLDPSEKPVHETWSWNGTQWKLLSQEGPASRGHFGLVYDSSHRQTVLYGGYSGTATDEFWTWKDNAWKQLDVPGAGTLSHFGMTVDTETDALYIFGGATSGSTYSSLTNKIWVLKEERWEALSLANSPPERGGPALGYDPKRKRVVMYGGFNSSRNDLADTWEWDGESWTCMTNCQQIASNRDH